MFAVTKWTFVNPSTRVATARDSEASRTEVVAGEVALSADS
jgi:hypothetical protein